MRTSPSRLASASLITAVFVCLCFSLSANAQPLAVDPYADLVDLHRLASPMTGSTGQTSSYDRTGGNGDAIFWYYLRPEPKRAVMADLRGPGCVNRIWVTAYDPATARIEIFVDDATTPTVSAYMRDFFGSGSYSPFVPPISTESTGSWVSYVPIPFERSCRIEAINARTDNNTIYYNVTYRQYLPNEPLPDVFHMPPTSAQQADLTEFHQQWANRGQDPKTPLAGKQTVVTHPTIAPGQTATIVNLSGAGKITGIRMSLSPNTIDVWSAVSIRARWDGNSEYAIDSPAGSFFASSFAPTPAEGLPIGFKNNQGYCYFPMPYADGAVLELHNPTGYTLSPTTIEVDYAPMPAQDVERMRFHADARAQYMTGGMPSYRILETEGRGHYLGCTISIAPAITHWGVLEGDEQIYVNGEPTASILGTGAEDYFNGGFYFSGGPVSLPFHGCSLIDNTSFIMSAYRLHITDAVVFKNGIIVDLEHGGVNEASGEYRTTAYYYRDDAAGSTPTDPSYPKLSLESVTNGGFEGGFSGYQNGEANGWIGYQSRDYYGQAVSTFSADTSQKASGSYSQKVVVAGYSSGAARSAGITQQVAVTRGSHYEVTAKLRTSIDGGLATNDVIAQLGVGAQGNTYHDDPSVVWADAPTTTNTWHEVSLVVTAQNDYLSIFAGGQRPAAKGWGTANVWIDDVTISTYTGTPPPPPLPDVINESFEAELDDFVWPMWAGPDGNDQQLERIWYQYGNPDGVWIAMVKGFGSTGKGMYQYVPNNWQQGQEYRIQAYGRNLGTASIHYSIGYQLDNAGAEGGVDATYGPTVVGTTSWQPLTCEFTYTGDQGVTIYLRAVNAGSPESAGFDYVTVEQLTFGPQPIPGDFDADLDVDQADFGHFQSCITEPNAPQNDPACAAARLDTDEDVDDMDLVLFMNCISGAGIEGDPNCLP